MAPPRGEGRSDRSLRLSIKNRTKGLCKKAYELATLCDVELALVCYPSDDAEPITWPPDRSKIEGAIHHYLETPAHRKLPKNQITLDNHNHNPNPNPNTNPGAVEKKDAAEPAASKAPEEADRLRIPFPDDEDKLIALRGTLDSRLEAVRKMIAIRRMEERRDPRPSARNTGKELALVVANAGGGDPTPSTRDPGKRLAQGQGWLLPAAASAAREDPRPSVRDAEKRVAGDCGLVSGQGNPVWSASPAAAGIGGGGAPNSWYPCPCCYCPVHGHLFTRWNGR